MPMISINPTTGEEISQFQFHSAEEIDKILSSVAMAQSKWRKRPIKERVELLRAAGKALLKSSDRYARLITKEMGKPIAESVAEIKKCAWNCEFYADHAPAFLADEKVVSTASESAIVYDPIGVVLAIMPWNYPFWQFFRFAAPAFAAGNGAILKHASNVPECALACEEVLREAGAPDGLMRTILIDTKDVARIIADDRIAAITLTGSTEVGAIVASQAGKVLKKQVLELGGSDPFIVLADADLEEAAKAAVKSRFINVGQSCVNAKRFIVEESVAEHFVSLFCAGVAKLKVGDPLENDTNIGPMARGNLRDALHSQVERSVAAGAKLVAGGSFIARPGFYYLPTVLDHVTPEMPAFIEETFGPVAAIIRVKNAIDAVALANQTEFGLGAAVWTRDLEKARGMARCVDAGAVFINGIVASDPCLPFGGIKRSGYGRELGYHGIREFTNIKTIWIGPTTDTGHQPGQGDLTMNNPKQATIIRPSEVKPHERGGGARTIPLVTTRVGSTSLLNGITEFEPSAAIPLHAHNCEESVMVLEGEAIVELDGVEHQMSVNDTTWVPANTPHRFINASNSKRMRIFWTYASVLATRTVLPTGDTKSIDSERS